MDNNNSENYLKKELYELIKQDESIFDFIQESALDGLWYWDLENPENEWMNQKFWTTLGYQPCEMSHKAESWQNIINKEDLEIALDNFNKHLADPDHPYDQIVRYKHKNESIVWIRCRGKAIRDTSGKPIRMLGAHHDVSKLKVSEEALRLAKEKAEKADELHNLILQTAMEGYWLVDLEGNILEVNEAYSKMSGYTQAELLLLKVTDLDAFESREDTASHIEKVIQCGEDRFESKHIRKDGSKFDVEVSVQYKSLDGGRIVCFARDISEQKQSEEERIAMNEFLLLFNKTTSDDELIKETTTLLKKHLSCDAVGIRLKKGDDYPYIETQGFSEKFVRAEKYLCSYRNDGKIEKDEKGNPLLECMCGNIICGRYDESFPFYTKHGSFWSNSTTKLLASTSESDREVLTRKRCNGEGYESVGLFPIKLADDIIGLLQINHKEMEFFSERRISFLEHLADNLSIAMSQRLIKDELIKNETFVRTAIDNIKMIFYLIDKNGIFGLSIGAGLKGLGLEQNQVVGLSVFDVYKDYPTITDAIRQSLDGEPSNFISEVSGASFLNYCYPFTNAKGNLDGIVGVALDITDRVVAEEKLEESERLLNETGRLAKLGGWEINLTGQTLAWTDETFLIHELDKSQQPDVAEAINFYHPDDREMVATLVEQSIKNGEPFNFEARLITALGNNLWVRAIGNAIETNGTITGVRGVIQDITERKKIDFELLEAKEKAEQNEYRFRTVAEASGIWVWEVDTNGLYTYVSSMEENILGYSPEELIGKMYFWDLFDNDIREEYKKAALEVFSKKEAFINFENPNIHKDGHKVILETTGFPMLNSSGELIGYRGADKNISERKISEENIKRSEERFRLLFERSPLGYQSLDSGGYFIEVNQAWLDTLGYTFEEVNGHWFGDFVTPIYREAFRERFPRFKEAGEVHNEFEMIHKNGSIRNVTFDGKVGYDNEGKFKQTHCVLRDISEQKKAEAELRDSEEKFRLAIQSAPFPIMIHAENGEVITINKAWSELTGYRLGDIPTIADWTEKAYGSKSQDILEYIDNLYFLNKEVNEGEYIINTSSGKQITWDFSSAPLGRFSDGRRLVISMANDVTERKAAEEELIKAKNKAEENERKLKESQEIAKLGSWELDIKTGIFTFNDNFYKIFHTTAEKVGGYEMSIEDYANRFVYPEDNSMVEEETQSAIECTDPNFTKYIEHRILYSDGGLGYISVRFYIVKDEFGNTIKTFGVNQDITEKKIAEEELLIAKKITEDNERKLLEAQILGNMGHWEYDIPSQKLTWSDNLYRIYEISKEDFEPNLQNVLRLCHPEDQNTVKSNFLSSIHNFSEFISENRVITPNGITKYIYSKGYVKSDDNGKAVSILGTVIDITDRKLSEQAIVYAKEKAEESDRLKTAFLANMSHEIRTPMNAILGFSQLLGSDDLIDDEKKEYISIINKRGHDLLNLINDILDISKIEANQLTIYKSVGDVNNLLKEIYSMFSSKDYLNNQKNVNLVLGSLLESDSTLLTDFSRLKQILINLVGNALKFTEQGYVEFGCLTMDGHLQFYVKDTGIGIPINKQELIFERFRQGEEINISRKFSGTGLGLTISKGLIDLLEGRIWVESIENEGSTFYFTIPINRIQPIKEKLKLDTANKLDWEDKLVLVVEDDPINLKLILKYLSYSKVKYITATTGTEALEKYKLNDNIDLVLMDIQLPDISGYEIIKEMLTIKPDAKIIAQTAHAFQEDKNHSIDSGCCDFLSKPLIRDNFLKVLGRHI